MTQMIATCLRSSGPFFLVLLAVLSPFLFVVFNEDRNQDQRKSLVGRLWSSQKAVFHILCALVDLRIVCAY